MAETKKILVSLPESLVKEVDFIVSIEEKNRSEFIKEAMKFYLREKRRVEVSEELKDGYMKMSKINLSLCQIGFDQDMKELSVYETTLNGREKV